MSHARTILVLTATALAGLVTAATAMAGGWAAVKLDAVPAVAVAGERLTVGFTVLQHGVRPVGMDVLEDPPIVAADGPGGRVTAEARPHGAVGHYVVDLLFPRAGLWTWQVTPGWFPPTTLEPLTVTGAAAAQAPASTDAAGVAAANGARPDGGSGPGRLLVAAAALTALAGVTALSALRMPRRRNPAAGPSGPAASV